MALRVTSMVSDLTLQKLLYFNIWSGISFGAAEIGLTIFKIVYLDTSQSPLTQLALPIIVVVWIVLEIFRVKLGYAGNLGEKVPETSAFWLLTLLPQLPLAVFLTFIQPMLLPMDLGAGVVHVCVCAPQLYFGFGAVRSFIRKQTKDFYRLCQEEALAVAAAGRKRHVRATEPELGGAWAGGVGASVPFSPVPGGGRALSAMDASARDAAAAVAAGEPLPYTPVTPVGVALDGMRHLMGSTGPARPGSPDSTFGSSSPLAASPTFGSSANLLKAAAAEKAGQRPSSRGSFRGRRGDSNNEGKFQ